MCCGKIWHKNYDLRFVEYYRPKKSEVKHLRILLHGPVGAGKSSFINSVDSCLRGKVNSNNAFEDAAFGSSFTKQYKTHKIKIEISASFYSFVFNDTMGIEKNRGVHEDDIILALKGHVKENYWFKPESPLSEDDQGYNPRPTLGDTVHILVFVVDACTVHLMPDEVVKKMTEVRQAACELGIPQMAILTKIDEACPDTKRNVQNAYKSEHLKAQVETLSKVLGLPMSCIFLIKNYSSETRINDYIDKMVLNMMRQIITTGEDYLDTLK